jgi:hypothetical protein
MFASTWIPVSTETFLGFLQRPVYKVPTLARIVDILSGISVWNRTHNLSIMRPTIYHTALPINCTLSWPKYFSGSTRAVFLVKSWRRTWIRQQRHICCGKITVIILMSWHYLLKWRTPSRDKHCRCLIVMFPLGRFPWFVISWKVSEPMTLTLD